MAFDTYLDTPDSTILAALRGFTTVYRDRRAALRHSRALPTAGFQRLSKSVFGNTETESVELLVFQISDPSQYLRGNSNERDNSCRLYNKKQTVVTLQAYWRWSRIGCAIQVKLIGATDDR